jgi:hypothetical protein
MSSNDSSKLQVNVPFPILSSLNKVFYFFFFNFTKLYLKVFTDPSITKVFHGADSDIEWLQKDLGVYVVGMFDTYQAVYIFSNF